MYVTKPRMRTYTTYGDERGSRRAALELINPRRACAARVTVVINHLCACAARVTAVGSVCLSVHAPTHFSMVYSSHKRYDVING